MPRVRDDHATSLPAARLSERWRDSDGAQVELFCWVEQVAEDTDFPVSLSRLHQRGEVVGGGLDQCYRRFEDGTLFSLTPQLLRLLPDPVGAG